MSYTSSLTLISKIELGRTTSDSTIEWWGKQDPKAMEEAFSEDGRMDLEYDVRST